MSIVDATKVASLVVTGLFGILALFVDFKDKDTKRITRWGYFSLLGIVLSSGFSVVSQLKDSANKAADHELDMRRSATPIDDGLMITFTFEMPCTKQLQAWCNQDKGFAVPAFDIPEKLRPKIDVAPHVSFTKLAELRADTGPFDPEKTDLWLSVDPIASAYILRFNRDRLTIVTVSKKAQILRNSGALMSTLDLVGSQVEISNLGEVDFKPISIAVRTKNKTEARLVGKFAPIQDGFRAVVSELPDTKVSSAP